MQDKDQLHYSCNVFHIKDHTVIIVAHRLSTIVDADIINIIDKGKLENYGTHAELLKKSKVYQNLYLNENSNS